MVEVVGKVLVLVQVSVFFGLSGGFSGGGSQNFSSAQGLKSERKERLIGLLFLRYFIGSRDRNWYRRIV